MSKHFLIFLVFWIFCDTSQAYSKKDESFREIKSWEISALMNVTADPCQDYYEFACGNWKKLHPASEKQKITSGIRNAIYEFYDRVSVQMNLMNPTDTASEIKLKNFYNSCKNFKPMTSPELRYTMKSIIKEFGNMPALEGKKWNSRNFDWIQLVGEIAHKYDIGIFVEPLVGTHPDFKSQLFYILPQKFILKDVSNDSVQKYAKTIENNLVKFVGSSRSYARKIASDIAKLEATLIKAAKNNDKEHETEIEDLTNKDYLKLINVTFGYLPEGHMWWQYDYVLELFNILNKSPKATVGNYIFYHLIHQFNEKFAIQSQEYFCIEKTFTYFLMIVSKMSHRVNQIEKTVTEYRELWQDVVTSMEIALEADKISWFDDKTREFALEKLHLMKLVVDTFEEYNLDEFYNDLRISPNNYIANIKSIHSFMAKNKWIHLDDKPDRIRELFHLASPSYYNMANVVMLPVPMLLSVFGMISQVPKALKYSRAGFLLGHEITHGFASNLRGYDHFGSILRYDGYFGGNDKELEQRQICLYNQYTNYKNIVKNLYQDKKQEENMSDIAGIYLAYNAYTRWLNDEARTEEELSRESLPDLNLTKEQLFFIHYSQTWCADYTDSYFSQTQKDADPHSIDSMRVVLPLLNFDEFAKTFNCPVGSEMNPIEKCSLL